MVIFDSRPSLIADLASTTGLGARAKIMNSLEKMDYRGLYSDTPAAIERAIYELKTHGREDARKVIILLTDGIVDTGNKQQDAEKITWLKEELARECEKSDIRIFGIAFTEDADYSLIQVLALRTHGEYFRAFSVRDIQEIFKKIREILSDTDSGMKPPVPEEMDAEDTPAAGIKASQPAPPVEETVHALPPPAPEEVLPSKGAGAPTRPDFPFTAMGTGIFILLIIIVLLVFLNRRARNSRLSRTGQKPEPRSDIPPAVLMDINNITGKKSFSLNKRINMIGRDKNNDVVIDQDTISSFHAIVEYRDGFFYLEDQRSMNKTSLSGREIEPQSPMRLKSGDEIMFHIYIFRFLIPDLIPSGKTMVDFRGLSGERPRKTRPEPSDREIPEIPKTIMVDVKNITGEKTITLKKRITKIGRGQGNDIKIPQESISGLHATIEYKNGFFFLEDQRSKNGTRLGGKELEPHSPRKLKSGDEIIFDVHKFIFLLEYELPSGDTGDRTVELS